MIRSSKAVSVANWTPLRQERRTGQQFTNVLGKAPLVRYMARVVLENVRATLATSSSDEVGRQ